MMVSGSFVMVSGTLEMVSGSIGLSHDGFS